MSKYVVSGYIGFDNFGDEAIAQILVSHLKEIGAEKITLISSNPQKTATLYGVESCGMLKFFKPILDCDTFISGGGSLLQDITSLRSLIYYLALITIAKIFNKKIIIFAQGFTPFRTKIGKFLTRIVIKNCHKITVRDIKSQELLKEIGIDSELISDPVFSIKTSNIGNKDGVGIQLRNFSTLNETFLEHLANNIEKFFKDKTIKLFSLQDSLDLDAIKTFGEKLQKRGLNYRIYNNLNVSEIINEISNLEFLIGMRFHSNLIAAKSGVKTLGINYDIKVENLAKSIGFPLINLDNFSQEQEFEQLLNSDTSSYNIPDFVFPSFK